MRTRPTQKQLLDDRNAERRTQMHEDIAEGRLSIRQMTPQEREQADTARLAAGAARAARTKRRG
jgi:hypothetical protein